MILLIFRFQESDLDDIHFDQQYVTTQATVVSCKKTLRSTVFKQYDKTFKIHGHINSIQDLICYVE